MNFSDGLARLKKGYRLTRLGWNGRNMFLMIVHPEVLPSEVDHYLSYIELKTVQDKRVPWVASHTDLLADDWETV